MNKIKIGVNMTLSTTIRFVICVKNLGFMMDGLLNFEKQIMEVKKKCFHTIRNLCKIRFLLNDDQCKLVVNSLVVSCLDYGNSFPGQYHYIFRILIYDIFRRKTTT